jgi:hypothetical protein
MMFNFVYQTNLAFVNEKKTQKTSHIPVDTIQFKMYLRVWL